jgi:two-component system sensor histidine kinase KdpD
MRSIVLRSLLSASAVALVTLAVFALKPVAPVLSLGVLYLFAVLPVAVLWGLAYAIPVSVASMLAFNFFFLPPLHTFALQDTENWVALAVYLVTAVVVSELASRERRRARALVAAADERERLARAALEAESLRRSDAIKTAVLRAVSHDLRSPLTAIRAASEGLQSSSIELGPDERAQLVEAIRVEALRLERLVANLLDLSRLEVGAAEPHPELWTVDSLVAGSLEQLGPDAERVSVDVPATLPPIRTDAAQIERVLANLIENALKFTPPPAPVEVVATTGPGEVTLRIADHGPGLTDDERERVFEPFERGAAGVGRRGSGLGLAIARGFAQANGCHLWVESSAGEGATFVLALPVAERTAKVGA